MTEIATTTPTFLGINWLGLLITSIIAAILGGLTAMKKYKIGPWLDQPQELDEPIEPPVQAPNLPQEPSKPPEPPPTLSKATLTNLCLAIRDFEGKPGDANYRNNNPGNARFNYGGYAPIYGVVKCSSAGFAIFKDYDTGWLYLKNMIKGQVKNHPNETLLQFMTRYAPPYENPTLKYANFIAARLGVDNSFPMDSLVLV